MAISAFVFIAFRHLSTAYPDHSCRGSKIGDKGIRPTCEIIIWIWVRGGFAAWSGLIEHARIASWALSLWEMRMSAPSDRSSKLRDWNFEQWDILSHSHPHFESRHRYCNFRYRYPIDNRFDARADTYLIENDNRPRAMDCLALLQYWMYYLMFLNVQGLLTAANPFTSCEWPLCRILTIR